MILTLKAKEVRTYLIVIRASKMKPMLFQQLADPGNVMLTFIYYSSERCGIHCIDTRSYISNALIHSFNCHFQRIQQI